MSVTEETDTPALTDARVVTRRGASGAAVARRRFFQRHLLLYLAGNLGVIALDVAAVAPPGMQWAWWVVVPWTLVFAIHFVGLKARGYSLGEMFIPPRVEPLGEDYPVPLDYELVRARQMFDGIEGSTASLSHAHPEAAREALDAARALVAAIEAVVAAARVQDEAIAERVMGDVEDAIDALEELHEAVIGVDVLDEPAADLPIQDVREKAESLRHIM